MIIYRPYYTSYLPTQMDQALSWLREVKGQFSFTGSPNNSFSLDEAKKKCWRNSNSKIVFLMKAKMDCENIKKIATSSSIIPTSLLVCIPDLVAGTYREVEEIFV